MWSAGCILGELLLMSKEYKGLEVPFNQRHVFKGSSCFPLSPAPDMKGDDIDQKDQLKVVLSILGQVDNCDKSFLTDEEQVDHLDDNSVSYPRVQFD